MGPIVARSTWQRAGDLIQDEVSLLKMGFSIGILVDIHKKSCHLFLFVRKWIRIHSYWLSLFSSSQRARLWTLSSYYYVNPTSFCPNPPLRGRNKVGNSDRSTTFPRNWYRYHACYLWTGSGESEGVTPNVNMLKDSCEKLFSGCLSPCACLVPQLYLWWKIDRSWLSIGFFFL